jgi:hypothetical protein
MGTKNSNMNTTTISISLKLNLTTSYLLGKKRTMFNQLCWITERNSTHPFPMHLEN